MADIKWTVKSMAAHLNLPFSGDPSVSVTGVNSIKLAGNGEIVFAETERRLKEAEKSNSSAIITLEKFSSDSKPLIKSKTPKWSFIQAARIFHPERKYLPGIHPSAVINTKTNIKKNVTIGANVVVERDVIIGSDTVVSHGCVIEEEVSIGDNCCICPNVSILSKSIIGDRVTIHSGTVIGGEGFGYTFQGDVQQKMPQLGYVRIEDDVEIGSNTTIDRATFGETLIKRGTKIDNLVHIAHNVTVGENTVIAAQTGISGSVTIENRVTLAGQVGIGNGAVVGEGAIVAAQSGVATGKKIKPNQIVFGTPSVPIDTAKRQMATLRRITNVRRQLISILKEKTQ